MMPIIIAGILFAPITILFRLNRSLEYVVERRRQIRRSSRKLYLLRNSKTNLLADITLSCALYIGVFPLIWMQFPRVFIVLIVLFFLAALGTILKIRALKENYLINGVD
jgi:hypothetical protein